MFHAPFYSERNVLKGIGISIKHNQLFMQIKRF